MPRTARSRLLAAVLAAVLCAGCVSWGRETSPSVVVGVRPTTEQEVLAALTVVALQSEGIDVQPVPEDGDTLDLRRRAQRDDVDLFWDYTGSALALDLLRRQAPPAAPGESFERVAEEDQRRHGLVWMGPTAANATLALFVRAEDVPQPDATLTALSRVLSEGGRLCADADFLARDGGLGSLAAEYSIGIDRRRTVPADEQEAIAAVAEGRCDAGLATATSGAAANAGLVPVADDLRVFPAFVVAPVVRSATLDAVPGLQAALDPVIALLSTDRLRQLNARVEAGEDPRAVAEEALGITPPTEA